MDFPQYRGGEEGHYRGGGDGQHHHPHYSSRQEDGEHHRPHYSSRQEDGERGYEEERYGPPYTSVYNPPYTSVYNEPAPAGPYPHTSHAPRGFAQNTPPGPYGTHGPSDPYYPHPQHPPSEVFTSESPLRQPQLPQGQLVRVFCKKNQAFNLAAELNTIIMKPANTQDEAQQWIKDVSYGTRVKDNYGYSAFALINKKTGQVVKHAKEKGQQILLTNYRPDIRDDDILWSESQDFGEGFMTVRCASNTLLNLTVFEGGKSIRNGSPLALDTWHKGDHQLWKLFPL